MEQVNEGLKAAIARLADLAVELLDVFTPAGDVTRASIGIDPTSGERVGTGGRVLAGVAAATSFVPEGAGGKAAEILFKSAHGARHLAGTGLKAAEVESAISRRILEDVAGASVTGNFRGRVEVGGKLIEYRAFTLSPGKINVGTYFPIR